MVVSSFRWNSAKSSEAFLWRGRRHGPCRRSDPLDQSHGERIGDGLVHRGRRAPGHVAGRSCAFSFVVGWSCTRGSGVRRWYPKGPSYEGHHPGHGPVRPATGVVGRSSATTNATAAAGSSGPRRSQLIVAPSAASRTPAPHGLRRARPPLAPHSAGCIRSTRPPSDAPAHHVPSSNGGRPAARAWPQRARDDDTQLSSRRPADPAQATASALDTSDTDGPRSRRALTSASTMRPFVTRFPRARGAGGAGPRRDHRLPPSPPLPSTRAEPH